MPDLRQKRKDLEKLEDEIDAAWPDDETARRTGKAHARKRFRELTRDRIEQTL